MDIQEEIHLISEATVEGNATTVGSSSWGLGSSSTNNGWEFGSSSSSSTTIRRDPIEKVINGETFYTPDVDGKPFKGQTFRTFEEGSKFYKEYAKRSGFETRYTSSKLLKGVDGYGRRYMVCNREGSNKRAEYKKNESFDTLNDPKGKKRKHPSIRIGCKAFVRFIFDKNENLWKIYELNETHNHSFVDEEDRVFLNSERGLTYTQKKAVFDMGKINLGPSTAFKYLKQSTGGFDKVGATGVDTKNFKRDWNEFIGERDADFLIESFTRKKQFLEDFSFEYTQGIEGDLTGVFWADEQAKRNFIAFGDIVGFDGTYRTNKYKMIFVPFTGIDNHKRCITFGGGLLTSESIESYKWLLKCFKKAFGKDPNVIITDQDPAILQAVPAIFPNSRHRLCMWHISQKFTDKIGNNPKKSDILKELSDLIWDETINKEIFESTWKKIMDAYDLSEKKWFEDMFNIRHLWIPAYFKECAFSALMRTTSRSEAENYFYGLISNPDLYLIEFMSHFDTALEGQRFVQRKNDHDSRYTTPKIKSALKLEVEAAQIFTRKVFFDIQAEIIASMVSCMSINVEESSEAKRFLIMDTSKHPKYHGEFKVTFFKDDQKLLCSCLRFELEGHLCRHCFYVLRLNDIETYPKQYVSRRWTKDAVPRESSVYNMQNVPSHEKKEEVHSVIRELHFAMDFCVDKLVIDLEKLMLFRDEMNEKMSNVEKETKNTKPMSNKEVIGSFMGVTQKETITILPPSMINNKGTRQMRTRIKGQKEIALQKAKAQKDGRECKKCNRFIKYGSSEKHDTRNCHKFPKEKETS